MRSEGVRALLRACSRHYAYSGIPYFDLSGELKRRVDPNLTIFVDDPAAWKPHGRRQQPEAPEFAGGDCMLWTSSRLSYGVGSGKHTRITGLSGRGVIQISLPSRRPK